MKSTFKLLSIVAPTCLCLCLTFVLGLLLGGRMAAEGDSVPTSTSCPSTSIGGPTSTAQTSGTVIPSPLPPHPSRAGCTTAVVLSVVDGDTLTLDNGETVRYIGIDAPETDECYGAEATEMNRQLVEGKTVILIGDVEDRGRYGRLLRYVIADGRFVNAELVRLGYARAESYGDNVMFQQVLAIFERYAYESGDGLWTECEED